MLPDSAPALLLVVLTCSVWELSQSLPVKGKEPMTDSCVLYAQTLLRSITEVLHNSTDAQRNLFSGIDCMTQNMELNMETNTPSVCFPKVSAESFSSRCISNILKGRSLIKLLKQINSTKDLNHYYKFLAAHSDPDSLLGQTVLPSLRELMEVNLLVWFFKAAAGRASTYDQRLNLCKVLKGFQVRTVTINRVIGYMNSGEHTK
uniref:Interleukin-12 subunit alpha n=1 Tax=Amphiprion ocellaris TaxID=80972 RepID=A0AAQ6APT8_AMPOC